MPGCMRSARVRKQLGKTYRVLGPVCRYVFNLSGLPSTPAVGASLLPPRCRVRSDVRDPPARKVADVVPLASPIPAASWAHGTAIYRSDLIVRQEAAYSKTLSTARRAGPFPIRNLGSMRFGTTFCGVARPIGSGFSSVRSATWSRRVA